MKNDKIILSKNILKYIKVLKPTGYLIYIYLSQIDSEKKYKLSKIMNDLNLSKSNVINNLKILQKINFIKINIKLEHGRKRLFIKSNLTGLNFKPLPSIEDIYILSNNKISNRDNILFNNNYKKLFLKIMKNILSFKRYDNKYYKSREKTILKFGKKEEEHIKNLLEYIGAEKIKKYVNWWLNEKSRKISGLSIGRVVCIPMLEEFRIKNKLNPDKNKINEKKKNNKFDKLKKKMLLDLYDDMKNKNYKLTKTDKEFINEALKENLLIFKNNKYIINFKR